jgi:hypothetical protein
VNILDRTSWMDRAVCVLERPAGLPDPDVPSSECQRCPVRGDCLAFRAMPVAIHPRGATRKPIKHGTSGGYWAHRRRGESACEECDQARIVHQTAYRARKATGVEADDLS